MKRNYELSVIDIIVYRILSLILLVIVFYSVLIFTFIFTLNSFIGVTSVPRNVHRRIASTMRASPLVKQSTQPDSLAVDLLLQGHFSGQVIKGGRLGFLSKHLPYTSATC